MAVMWVSFLLVFLSEVGDVCCSLSALDDILLWFSDFVFRSGFVSQLVLTY